MIKRALALLLLAAPVAAAHAQMIPNISAPKAAAQRAAAATNAHTDAETANQEMTPAAQRSTQRPATQSAQPAQSAQSAPAARPGLSSGVSGGDVGRSVSTPGAKGELSFERETFEYSAAGRRDPFVSLMANGDLRPILTDLQLKAILYDARGHNSVAILRDLSTKDQYRVKVGQTLGRMRVSAIRQRAVTFTIDEFGYSRQEVLALGSDNTQERKP
jgi:hypothetical protein